MKKAPPPKKKRNKQKCLPREPYETVWHVLLAPYVLLFALCADLWNSKKQSNRVNTVNSKKQRPLASISRPHFEDRSAPAIRALEQYWNNSIIYCSKQ